MNCPDEGGNAFVCKAQREADVMDAHKYTYTLARKMRLERQPEGAAGLSDHSHILSYFRLLLIAATLWCLFTQCTASGFKEQVKGHGLAGHGTPSKKAHRVGDTVACKRKACIPV
jgi:hypothetical protein